MSAETGPFTGSSKFDRRDANYPSVPGQRVSEGTPRIRVDRSALVPDQTASGLAHWQACADAGEILYVAETQRAEATASSG